ncbi:MAG: ferritin family protein [Desulfatitalea sp.]|nr:ferritin family protein [Desulfatitalea sp.]NNK00527.1 ferritin family protein [Desulfatitalea sp.]
MMYDFNADDMFEIAEQLERNGAAFYRKAAGAVDAGQGRDLLLKLAAMEDDHEKAFAQMRTQLTSGEKQATVFDPAGEAATYLKALADTRVFFEKQIDTSSMQAILKDAITAEKDSIVFYLGMRQAVPENLGRDRLDDVIQEEMGHIRLLSMELTALR